MNMKQFEIKYKGRTFLVSATDYESALCKVVLRVFYKNKE